MSDPARTDAWAALAESARCALPVPELFERDPERFARFSFPFNGLLLDLSRHPLTDDVLGQLLAFAHERDLPGAISALFRGEPVNRSEGRPALHVALRGGSDPHLTVAGERVSETVGRELARMESLVTRLRNRDLRGASGEPVTDVVHLGVGGSELGPGMAVDALADPHADGSPRVWFASSTDGRDLAAHLRALDPRRTAFIIASKSFTTIETLTAARTAYDWLADGFGATPADALMAHFIGVSANDEAMAAFGIPEPHRLHIRDWVGGRYSLASPMGLPLAIRAGMETFRALLAGMQEVDRHFHEAPLAENLPVLMALTTVWQLNHHAAAGHVVLPYHPALRRVPAYLQQLDMESLGKTVTQGGQGVTADTGGIFWGDVGTNAQHSFFQWLHQGRGRAVIEMWVPGDDPAVPARHGGLGPASALGQAQALMQGQPTDATAPHRHQPGGKPVTMLFFPALNARRLGQLIALHEHRVYAQAVLWDINPFDQWGVELGKKLSGRLAPVLRGDAAPPGDLDGATRGGIEWLRAHLPDDPGENR